MEKHLKLPLTFDELLNLEIGDEVYLTGKIYTARDAAHMELIKEIKENTLDLDLRDATIYYAGPTPKKPKEIIGSIGPTSSYRMDKYSKALLEKGVKIMIGKGPRNREITGLLKEYKAVYLTAIGGTGALISKSIKEAKCIRYPHLLAEAIYELEVKDFYAIVAIDSKGNDIFSRKNE